MFPSIFSAIASTAWLFMKGIVYDFSLLGADSCIIYTMSFCLSKNIDSFVSCMVEVYAPCVWVPNGVPINTVSSLSTGDVAVDMGR